jgi:hypothetical protein
MILSLAFFLQLGCVIGVLARMSIEPRLRRATRAFAVSATRPASYDITADCAARPGGRV